MCTGKQSYKVRYYLGSGHCQDISEQIPGELGVTMKKCSILEDTALFKSHLPHPVPVLDRKDASCYMWSLETCDPQ